MSYFSERYGDVSYPLEGAGQPGLRKAQLGAAHSLASHFSTRSDPALIVMPTGSGKTAVLMMAPYILGARRILFLTPSRLVRDQIASDFEELKTLKFLRVLPDSTDAPAVLERQSSVGSAEDLAAIVAADVVVATPYVFQPDPQNPIQLPTDLFDLILVDEAHHSEAPAWQKTLAAFPEAKQVFCTATPFRRDEKAIKARFAFVYSLKQAVEDGIYGQITYMPVPDQGNVDANDIAIAEAAATQFAADFEAGYDHRIIVRVDSKARADVLEDVYREYTGLLLQVVHSKHTATHVRSVLRKLDEGTLDGIICVDMFGEGFDYPRLKISALHSPHKSLEVTLQFIGRFARTNHPQAGPAHFFAVPQELSAETSKLYKHDATWQELIIDLSQARTDAEAETREAIERYETQTEEPDQGAEVSIYSLHPDEHAKIYRVTGTVDLDAEISFSDKREIVDRWKSDPDNVAVFVTKKREMPSWSMTTKYASSHHDLFVVYHDTQSDLLFILATDRTISTYEAVASKFVNGSVRILPLYMINRVLRGVSQLECSTVGMRNRLQSTNVESYRMMAGRRAQKAIRLSDGKLYERGHVSARGIANGDSINIGFSSSSKVWSGVNDLVPRVVAWCSSLARKIESAAPTITNTPLDQLIVGAPIVTIQRPAIAAEWDIDVFRKNPKISYVDANGAEQKIRALDLDITVDRPSSTPTTVRLWLDGPGLHWEVDYTPLGPNYFEPVAGFNADALQVVRGFNTVPFMDYIRNNPFAFYLSDFSKLQGEEHSAFEASSVVLPNEHFESVDWTGNGVNIRREFDEPLTAASIHGYLAQILPERAPVVFYDHRTGEMADYITFCETSEELIISFYHCKGAGGANVGNRVDDVYEVCGQVVKSLLWIENETSLVDHMLERETAGSYYVQGDYDDVTFMLAEDSLKTIRYEIVLVQPGFRSNCDPGLQEVLAASNDYIQGSGALPLLVMCSV